MTDSEILTLVKADIGLLVLNTNQTAFLESCLASAKSFIAREGIVLDQSDAEDVQLIEMYTAYLWRKRATNDPMPRMLRWALNNRLLGEITDES